MIAFVDLEYYPISKKQCLLASIGIVREDGEELYLVADGYEPDRIKRWWFYKNVWKKLQREPRLPVTEIRDQVYAFLVRCNQLVTMAGGQLEQDLLRSIVGHRHSVLDLKPWWRELGEPVFPPRPIYLMEHHALHDAHYHKLQYEFLHEAPRVPVDGGRVGDDRRDRFRNVL